MAKIELHLHTAGNSGCAKETVETIADLYKERGYDAIVCTNHFNNHILKKWFKCSAEHCEAFFKDFYRLKELCEAKGIRVYFGAELALGKDYYNSRPPLKRCAELLLYGCTAEEFEECAGKLLKLDYKSLYKFADDKGWIVVQAHPYREHTKRINAAYLHGLEVVNGHPNHFNRNALAKRRAQKFDLIETQGSDFHFVGGEGTAMYFDKLPQDEKELVKMLKQNNKR